MHSQNENLSWDVRKIVCIFKRSIAIKVHRVNKIPLAMYLSSGFSEIGERINIMINQRSITGLR